MTIFADAINWDMLLRTSRQAVLIGGQRPAIIPPVSATTSSRFVIVKVASAEARRTWRLGCWASVRNLFEASFASQILTTGTELQKYPCSLSKATLIEIPDFQSPPYLIFLEFPRWLQSVDVEIWYYNP